MGTYSQDELIAVRDRHEAWLMSQPGVTGTGIGMTPSGELVMRIFTSGMSRADREAIAKHLAGTPIAWEEGDVVAY